MCLSCKDLFQIKRQCFTATGDNPSLTPSDTGLCSSNTFYEPFSPPVFHKFFYDNWSEDLLLEVALTSETIPPRGTYILFLAPNEPPNVKYHVTLRMAQTPDDPSLYANISAFTGVRTDGIHDSDPLGEAIIKNGQNLDFPSYAGGKKYIVNSSFKWIVFKAEKHSLFLDSKRNGEKTVGAVYVDFKW